MSMDELATELLREIERIDAALNHKALVWYDIRKALNILKTQNYPHYPTITRKLFSEIRTIYIEQLPMSRLFPHLDRAFTLALHLDRQLTKQRPSTESNPLNTREVELEIAC